MTKGQREIITRIKNGGRLIRSDGRCYEWQDNTGRTLRGEKQVKGMTVHGMVTAGLLEVKWAEGDHLSRHLPTDFALAALESE